MKNKVSGVKQEAAGSRSRPAVSIAMSLNYLNLVEEQNTTIFVLICARSYVVPHGACRPVAAISASSK